MNHDDYPRTDDPGLPEDGDDIFVPATVDQAIERLLRSQSPAADDASQLVRALAAEHALPAEAEAALARVAARVAQAPLAAGRPAASAEAAPRRDPAQPPALDARRMRADRDGARFNAALARSLAAVLVVGLLLGAFIAVFRFGARPVPPIATWQDVSLNASRTGKLPSDVTIAGDTSYAVAGNGTIYACNQNHLWYSQDGGQSYRSFQPGMAALFAHSASLPADCAIATVPGAAGVFVAVPDPSATPSLAAVSAVGYAEPGEQGWQVLRLPATHPTIGAAPYGITLDIGQFWQRFANNVDGTQASVDGPALFTRLPYANQPQGPQPLIATGDVGQNWDWLDLPIEQQGSSCLGMIADPVAPSHLFCTTGLPGQLGTSVAETHDYGDTWRSSGLSSGNDATAYAVIAANARMVYAGKVCPICQAGGPTLYRRPLAGGAWQLVPETGLGSDINPATFVGVLPDGTIYAEQGNQPDPRNTQVQVQALSLAPTGTRFSPVGSNNFLRLSGRIAFTLADGVGGAAPALYAHAQVQPSTQPLYRLALPPSTVRPAGTPTEVQTAPTPTPPPFAPTPSPTAYSCPAAQGDLDTIQPGGLAADISTFAPRWGPFDGYAAGSSYFGKYADTGQPIIQLIPPAPNQRVLFMSYTVDSKTTLTQANAATLARTILPADAVPVGTPQTITVNQTPSLIALYCSPAYGAAFPPGTQAVDAQGVNVTLTGNGMITVLYTLRADGSVFAITCAAYAPFT